MQRHTFHRLALLCAALAAAPAAFAHITLVQGSATAGSSYQAAFHVGHPCRDASATNAVTVRLPAGFVLDEAQPRAGWQLDIEAQATPVTVRWRAQDAANAVPSGKHAQFVLRGRLPAQPGVLYFKVLQGCDVGSADWAEVAEPGAAKPAFPAARLELLAPGSEAPATDAAAGHMHMH